MLIAVALPEHLPEWLYPYRLAPLSGTSLSAGYLGWQDLPLLWKALGGTTAATNGPVNTHCDVGFDHDAIDALDQVTPEFVAALAALPDSERWRVARDWATGRLGRRPNDSQLAQYKTWLRELSQFALEVESNGWIVVYR
jgi:hypothetical protein